MLALLLNWRIWAVIGFAVLEAWAGYKLHHAGYEEGRAEVQSLFDAYKSQSIEQAMAAQVAANAKEHAMTLANEKVTDEYESLKTATSTAVRALDSDRVRLQEALRAARNRAAPGDTQAPPGPDATPESRILGECLQRYESVAGDAQALSDTVKALQDYVRNVVKPQE